MVLDCRGGGNMIDMRLKALCRSWEAIALEMLIESKKEEHKRPEKERLQRKAALHLNMASDLKSLMFDSVSSGK